MIKRTLSILPVLGVLALAHPASAGPVMHGLDVKGNVTQHMQVRDGDRDRGTRSAPVTRRAPLVVRRDRDGDRGYRGTRYLWGGLPFFFYDGYYHGDCGWLLRRARDTGSAYWWRRYRQCRND